MKYIYIYRYKFLCIWYRIEFVYHASTVNQTFVAFIPNFTRHFFLFTLHYIETAHSKSLLSFIGAQFHTSEINQKLIAFNDPVLISFELSLYSFKQFYYFLLEKFLISMTRSNSRLYFIILFHNWFQIIFFTRSIILNLYTIFSKLYYFSFIIFTHSRILNSILTTNSGTILCLFKFITLFIKIYSLHDSFQIIPFSAPLHPSYPVNIQEFFSSSH